MTTYTAVISRRDIDPLPWGIGAPLGEERLGLGRYVSQTIMEWHRSGFLLDLERKWLGSNTRFLEALNVKWTRSASAAANVKAGFGTPTEARAMLEKVVLGMKADPANTLTQIIKGEGGFRDRDLYPYCIGPDGKYVAHPDPSRIGLVYKDVKDKMGKGYGYEVSVLASEGEVGEVHYVFVRPADGMLRPKVGLYTKVAGYICSSAIISDWGGKGRFQKVRRARTNCSTTLKSGRRRYILAPPSLPRK